MSIGGPHEVLPPHGRQVGGLRPSTGFHFGYQTELADCTGRCGPSGRASPERLHLAEQV